MLKVKLEALEDETFRALRLVSDSDGAPTVALQSIWARETELKHECKA